MPSESRAFKCLLPIGRTIWGGSGGAALLRECVAGGEALLRMYVAGGAALLRKCVAGGGL